MNTSKMSDKERTWFCDAWTEFKPVLETMSSIGNIWVKLAVAVVIAAGNTAHKKLCS